MGFLQQAGKTIGSQQTSGGLLQQAGVSSLSESPKITVAPKKKTTAQVTVSKPNSISTPVQSDGFLSTVKKTTSNIIGDIKLSLAPKKIVSPIPDSQIIKQTVSNKKISILPGQKYLEPKQLQKAFPQTATAIQDFKTPQKTDAKKAAIDAWSAIKDPFIEQIKRQQENVMPSKTLAEKTAKQLKVYTGFANVAMSPIGAVFAALNNSNLKTATKALAIPFVAVGEGASKISDKIIDELPLDKKTKETLKPAFSEAASLAAQVALGEFVKVGTKKAKSTINRVGPEVFEKFTKNVIEESGSSKTINLTAEQVRDIQRNMASKEVVEMVAKLDLKSSEWRKAVTEGLTIEIPAEKITRIMDKPYWEKMKSVFGKKPTDVVKTSTGTPSTRTGFAGYLTDGTYTPQEVIGKVIGSPLEKTPEGKALVKSALDAQKRGMDIEVTSAKEGTPPPSPTAKKTGGGVVKEGSVKPQTTEETQLLQEARKYKSAEEFVRAQEKNYPDYLSGHSAPIRGEDYAPAFDLTKLYPEDVYSPQASRLYGSGFPDADKKALDILNKVKGNPDADITVFRAVPLDKKYSSINNGDWITLTRDYAQQHGESNLGGKFKILEKKVKADEIFTDANSLQEFGYDARRLSPSQLTDIYNQATKEKKSAFEEEADQSLLKSEMAQEEATKETPQSKKALDELKQKQQAIELAKQDNAVKKSILEQFSTNEIRAMRAIKRSVSALEKKGLDATNVTKTQSYKDHIEGVMSALNTNSEDVALDYILNELPDALTSASTRQDLEEIKVLKSRIMPKEVSVPREQLPTGEGKPKVSKLEARMKGVMDKATKEQIEDLGLSTYNTLNRKETIAKAAEYVLENPKEALSVLQGNTQAPEGIPPEAIYVALTQVAKGDLTLATKLASLQATALGQRISLLAELDPNSPVKLLNEVYKVREELAKKRHGGKSVKEVKEKIVKRIKEKVKAPDKYDWNNFISALEC